MLTYKICSACKLELEENEDNFGYTTTGNFRGKCRECHRKQSRAWKAKNKQRQYEYNKQYLSVPENRKAHNKKRRSYTNNKRKNDVHARVRHNLSSRIRLAIQNGNKSANTQELLGCTTEQLRQHIESQWESWMNWDNYGVYKSGGTRTWHIDHIQPCASFDLTTEEGQRACFHYTNLQPLCAVANIKKGDNIEL